MRFQLTKLLLSLTTLLLTPLPSTAQVTWQKLPGCAIDIGVGQNSSAWVIGCNAVNGGYGIYSWNGSAWQQVDGGAVKIAVDPNGTPWVVNSSGAIFKRSGTSWQTLPGCAIDIGVGRNSPWVIGCNAVSGGYGIYDWDGSAWQQVGGGAVAIAVAPSGTPWVVNSSGEIFRWL